MQYAIPKDHDTIALLYNKAIFDKYGVDYPTDDWSRDDVLEAAAHNTADPDAAYSLISYFCSEKGQLEQSELGVTMGGMVGVSEAFANAFEGMDVSAFTRVEEEGTLFFRPYIRNSVRWSEALQTDAFLPAWQDPSDPDLMASCCDRAQQIIEECIAQE